MAVLNLDYLKTLFQTFDKPTEDDFEDLIDTLSTTIRIITYNIAGSGDVWTDVNSTVQLKHDQKTLMIVYHDGITYLFDAPLGTYGVSGIQTNSSNYINIVESQFTSDQINKILALISDDITVTTTLSIEQFEKGVKTETYYSSHVDYGDAVISSIKLNGSPYNISSSGSSYVNVNNSVVDSMSYNLIIQYTFNGTPKTYNETVSIVAYTPQFYGLSNITDYDTATTTDILLNKYIGPSNNLVINNVYNNMYLWYILSSSDPYVYDQNGNRFRSGAWGDKTYIIKKDGMIQLEDGTYTTVTFYRTYSMPDSMGIEFKCETK